VRLAVFLLLAAGAAFQPAAAPTFAQEAPTAQVTTVSSKDWPTVEAAVTVLDGSGRPVTGLKQDDFAGSIGGSRLETTGMTPASAPGVNIAVVLTFDTSGSMGGAPLAAAKEAAKSLLPQMGPEDQAAVVQFSSTVSTVQKFTSDRAAIERAIDSLSAGGDTALYSGVQHSIALAEKAPLARRSVVLLSDGVDFGSVSTVDAEATYQLATESDAIIFTIGLGDSIDEEYLRTLAELGKGQYLPAPTTSELTAAYESAANVLRNQYIVTFDASGVDAAAVAGQPLEVTVSAGGTQITTSAAVDVPVPATAAPTPGGSATPVPATPPVSESGSGGGFPVLLAAPAAIAALALLAGGGFLLVRRRQRERRAEFDVSRFRQPDAAPPVTDIARAVEPETALGWLVLPDGKRVPLGQSPVTIGFTADCTVQLPNGAPGALDRARVWWRDGSFMLHNLSRTGSLKVGGKPVTWVVLEDGDEIQVAGTAVVFSETEAPNS
jgi:tight adherence protein B